MRRRFGIAVWRCWGWKNSTKTKILRHIYKYLKITRMKKIARGLFAEPSVGARFNCGSKRANVGIAYAIDGVLDRTTDAYRRRYPAQVRIKFGIEF